MAQQTLHVLLRKEDLDNSRIAASVVVVLDVLFATTTIAAVLHGGAAAVIPVVDKEEALAAAAGRPSGDCLLAGEEYAQPIPGFADSTPVALQRAGVAGKTIIYSTTNGTVALRKAAGARAVYAAALVSGHAVAQAIRARHERETVLLVCAGSAGGFNLEDFYGAGYLVHCLTAGDGDRWQLTDAARAALGLFSHPGWTAESCLRQSRIGRMMAARGQEDEVAYAARLGSVPVVPKLENGVLRAYPPIA